MANLQLEEHSTPNIVMQSPTSLRSVAERLVHHLSTQTNPSFDLNTVSSTLGVSKRRLYDILNILQPLGVISRKSSGTYTWKTFESTCIPNYSIDNPQQHMKDISASFISYVRKSPSDVIKLSDLTSKLFSGSKDNTRRLYDLIAVYEALNLISKQSRSDEIHILPRFRSLFSINLIPLKKRPALTPINTNILIEPMKSKRLIEPIKTNLLHFSETLRIEPAVI